MIWTGGRNIPTSGRIALVTRRADFHHVFETLEELELLAQVCSWAPDHFNYLFQDTEFPFEVTPRYHRAYAPVLLHMQYAVPKFIYTVPPVFGSSTGHSRPFADYNTIGRKHFAKFYMKRQTCKAFLVACVLRYL